MTETITKAMKRPGVAPASLAGLGVFVALLLIGFLQALFSTLSLAATSSIVGDYIGQLWFGQVVGALTQPLPFAVGVFLCLWQVAPIAPGLRLAHVVTRSILAALLGGAVMWIVFLVFQIVVEVTNTPFATPASDVLATLGTEALQSFFHALEATVGYVSVAVLAGILLWGWLQRHPSSTKVHGTLDEV